MKTKNLIFKTVILVLLFLNILSIETFAVNQSSPDKPVLSIPFKFDGRILIPIKIKNAEEMDIILDSGFPQNNIVLLMHKELGEKLDLQYASSQNAARGAGSGEKRLIHLAVGIDVALSHIDLGKKIIGVMDDSREESLHHNKGVLGGAVFVPYVVKIDFDRTVIDLYSPDTFKAEEGWEEIPLLLSERNLPMVETSFSMDAAKNIQRKFLLDTGASGNIFVLDEKKQIKGPAETVYMLSGTGLRGDVFSNMGRISNLKLGKYELNNMISAMIPEKEMLEMTPLLNDLGCTGLIGIEVMSHFNMIFDYSHKKLYIRPNKNYGSPFELNMAGMVVRENPKGEYIVYHVINDKEASRKGLIKGDKISKINGKAAADLSYQELKSSFEKDGGSVTVEIIRNGKTIKVQLKLERII